MDEAFELEEATERNPLDVNGDGTVRKVILEPTSYEEFPDHPLPRPVAYSECLVHYEARLEDGEIFESSRLGRAAPVWFTVGVGAAATGLCCSAAHAAAVRGWSDALRTMKREEKARFVVQPSRAYGEDGLYAADGTPKVAPDEVVAFVIELIDFSEDVSDDRDGSVLKKVTTAGARHGAPPATADIHFALTRELAPGEERDDAGVRAAPRRTARARDAGNLAPAGLWGALRRMRKDEEAVVTWRPGATDAARRAVACHGWIDNEDARGDGSVVKRRLREGEEFRKPDLLATCLLYVRVVVAADADAAGERDGRPHGADDDAVVVDTFPRGWAWAAPAADRASPGDAPLSDAAIAAFDGSTLVVDEPPAAPLCAGLDDAVRRMNRGELAEVLVAPGPAGYDAAAAAALGDARLEGARLRVTAFLVDFRPDPNPWDLAAPAKLAASAAKRDMGNACFKAGDHARAVRRYTTALLHANCDSEFDDAQRAAARALKLASSLNRAAAHLKLDRAADALKDCDAALELDARSVKALYRRGAALVELSRWEEAREALASCLELDPHNAAARKLRADLRARARAQDRQEMGKFANSKMFKFNDPKPAAAAAAPPAEPPAPSPRRRLLSPAAAAALVVAVVAVAAGYLLTREAEPRPVPDS